MRQLYIVTKVQLLNGLAAVSKGQHAAEGVPLYDVRWEMAKYLLPEVGFWMAERNVDEISKADLVAVLEKRLAEPVPDWYWAESKKEQHKKTMQVLVDMGARKILEDMEECLNLFTMVEEDIYEFANPNHLEFLAGIGMHDRLVGAAKLFEAMEMENDEGSKRKLAVQAAEKLAFFENRKWPRAILNHCGNEFRIPSTCPIGGGDEWHQDHNWEAEFDTVMNFFRRVPENPLMDVILENRKHGHRKAKYYSEQNLCKMLRVCRIQDRVVDFTGIDFHGIDLTGVDLSETIFGRRRGGERWYANLANTGVELIRR